MNIERTIRNQVMRGGTEAIRALLLNDSQIELIKLVGKKDCMTATELANQLGVSIQNASSKLKSLFARGYLERLQTAAESGGIEYVYRAQGYGQDA